MSRRPPLSRLDARLRARLAQSAALGLAAAMLWWLSHNAVLALDERGLTLGFGFLRQPANFDIGESWIRYRSDDNIARALAVGLVNTLVVSAVGIVLSIVFGFAVGVMRLSENASLRNLVRAYVEIARNVPLLLLLLFLVATLRALPPPDGAFHPLAGVYLSNRGLTVPTIALGAWPLTLMGASVVALAIRRRLGAMGNVVAIALVVGLIVAVLMAPRDMPRPGALDVVGGRTLSPEFAALLAALVLHHAANVSEIVRGAILAVPKGQREAAAALGLSRWQAMRFVILPHALRAMVPLLASTAVSLLKNSSLAVAIGFPDIVSILNTTGNQTGHAVETMLIMMATYLVINLAIGATLERYNQGLLRTQREPA